MIELVRLVRILDSRSACRLNCRYGIGSSRHILPRLHLATCPPAKCRTI